MDYTMIFALLLSVYLSSPTSANLLNDIIFTQYFNDPAQTCNADGASNYAPFEGGDDYFNAQFQSLVAKVDIIGKELRNLNIKKNSIAPSATEINDYYKELPVADVRVITADFLFGENTDVVFCYKDGVLRTCVDDDQNVFETTTSSSWFYSYVCNRWQATLLHQDLKFVVSSVTKVVLSITVDLQDTDINQCSNSTDADFVGTALCSPSISQCKHVSGRGFVVGSYLCQCLHCSECNNVTGQQLSSPEVNATKTLLDGCTPPVPSTESSGGGAGAGGLLGALSLRPQFIKVEVYILLAIQAVCTLMTISFMVVVFVFRSTQVMKYSIWSLLELVLFGALLKYLQLLWLAFKPSDLTCVVYQWFGEVSFVCMYLAIVLKIRRTYMEVKKGQETSTAIGWLLCLLVTLIYLSSWTSVVWSYLSLHNISLVADVPLNQWVTESTVNMMGDSLVPKVVTETVCALTGWNYVTQISEMLVVLYGIFMCIRLRGEKSVYSESKWYAVVLTIELITSIIYYIIGDVLIIESFWSLLMTFMYHQLTVTLVLLIIFCPKFYYIKNAPRYSPAKPSSMESNELNIKVTNSNDTEGELKKAYDEIDELKAKLSTYEARNSESKARSPPLNKQPLERPVVSPRNKPNWQRKDVSSEHEVQPLNEDVAKPKVEPSPRRKSITRHTAM